MLRHVHLGHVHHSMIKQMVSRKLVNGIQLVDPEAVPKVCHSCVYGKQHRAPFPSPTNKIRAQKPGISFHNDLSGKMPIDSLGWSCYYILFKDDHSKYQLIFFSAHKSL